MTTTEIDVPERGARLDEVDVHINMVLEVLRRPS